MQYKYLKSVLSLCVLTAVATMQVQAAEGDLLTVESGKDGVMFGEYPTSDYDNYKKITDEESTYKQIQFEDKDKADLKIFGETLNLVGAGDGKGFIVDGSGNTLDNATVKAWGGGTLNIGSDAQQKLTVQSLEHSSSGELHVKNTDLTVKGEFTSGSGTATFDKVNLKAHKITAEDTLHFTNSTVNADYFIVNGDDISFENSKLDNSVRKEKLTDDDGNQFEAYNYRVTNVQEADFDNLTVKDSAVELGLTSMWVGKLDLQTTKTELNSSSLIMHVSDTNTDGSAMGGNGFSKINFNVGDYTTLAISHFTDTKSDSYKVDGGWRTFTTEAAYADSAVIQQRIDETVKNLQERNAAAPKAILYTSMPLRFQNSDETYGGSIAVGSDAKSELNNVSFGSNSLFIVDMDVAGSYWQVAGRNNEPVISTLDQGNKVTLNVADTAMLYFKGLSQETQEVTLVNDQVDVKSSWKTDNIYTDNPLYGFKFDDTGTKITAQIQKASVIFGDKLKAGKLFDQASAQGNGTQQWLSSLVSSLGQGKSFSAMSPEQLEKVGATADAMLSPAGATAVYSTAFDLAVEMVESMQANVGSAKEDGTHVWAKVLGGKTTIDQLPADNRNLSVKRDSYGVAVGADHAVATGLRLGLAANFSSGNTKNDAVGAKDEFTSWGLMAYSRYGVGPFTLDGHAGLNWLKSDVSNDWVSNKVAVDTKVYNAGLRGSVGVLLGETIVYPFIGVEAYHLRGEGYDVADGIQAHVAATSSVLQFPIGVRWAGQYQTKYGFLTPTLALTYARNVGDRDISTTTSALGEAIDYDFTYASKHAVKAELGLGLKNENYEYGLLAGYVDGSEDRQAYKLSANAAYHF